MNKPPTTQEGPSAALANPRRVRAPLFISTNASKNAVKSQYSPLQPTEQSRRSALPRVDSSNAPKKPVNRVTNPSDLGLNLKKPQPNTVYRPGVPASKTAQFSRSITSLNTHKDSINSIFNKSTALNTRTQSINTPRNTQVLRAGTSMDFTTPRSRGSVLLNQNTSSNINASPGTLNKSLPHIVRPSTSLNRISVQPAAPTTTPRVRNPRVPSLGSVENSGINRRVSLRPGTSLQTINSNNSDPRSARIVSSRPTAGNLPMANPQSLRRSATSMNNINRVSSLSNTRSSVMGQNGAQKIVQANKDLLKSTQRTITALGSLSINPKARQGAASVAPPSPLPIRKVTVGPTNTILTKKASLPSTDIFREKYRMSLNPENAEMSPKHVAFSAELDKDVKNESDTVQVPKSKLLRAKQIVLQLKALQHNRLDPYGESPKDSPVFTNRDSTLPLDPNKQESVYEMSIGSVNSLEGVNSASTLGPSKSTDNSTTIENLLLELDSILSI
ncbi:hypothetical protein BB560_003573 [Smittium megazygosporum]|uniref:Uncharacterized protein n=1 Tax=Smittium megazygosporum TaxID=133381 RepID=A0A2T9ZBR9_9FUNG|nr:hypothetical protein BB560_003573 [Smittium megazygosporum]